MQTLIVTSPFFYKDTFFAKAFMLSMANMNHVFKHLNICKHFKSRSWYSVGQDQIIMAAVFNGSHIIDYHMDAQCLLGWHRPISLVLIVWLSNVGSIPAFFHPDMINPAKPNIVCYTKFFEGVVGYSPIGFPCT